MNLTTLDYALVVLFFTAAFGIGFWTMYRAGKNSSEFFLAGRSMPWWLLGISLVATTFAADTPNLVTDIVRRNGVAGNWEWWAFLLTGLTTVFIYAGLWRRLGLMTDIEFYEIRYAGKSGAFLRGFRTLFIGLIANTVIMASVTLAIIKILGVLLGSDPYTTVFLAGGITMIFSMLGGLSAVLWADFVMFIIAMLGSAAAAYFVLQLPQVGGLQNLLAHPNVADKLAFFPSLNNWDVFVTVLIIPLTIQWWSVWYPGSEPGGGSYVAQRMLAAKNENHAAGATLFFNICHYAVRPWPWIIVALASLVVFPTVDSLREAFPNLPERMMQHDMAYPAMLTFLPPGWAGLVLVSLFAAYMSTIATHLSLGSSYMVNDFHCRFFKPEATEKQRVFYGRLWTMLLMIFAGVLAVQLTSALDSFRIILQIGAGTGLLFLLRWFWQRINAWSEIAAMTASFCIAMYFQFGHPAAVTALALPPETFILSGSMQLVAGVCITTVIWIIVTFLTPPTDEKTLREFVRRSHVCGPGWNDIIRRAAADGDDLGLAAGERWNVPAGILCTVLGCIGIYGLLFAGGLFLYAQPVSAAVLCTVSAAAFVLLYFVYSPPNLR
ncbi:MAG: Na+:solute symporter [Planctomycetaceae bacterium]|jgi:Na+/proline symporter|nr:Na+:solute symporter [Planctomycetaceae bacterium]